MRLLNLSARDEFPCPNKTSSVISYSQYTLVEVRIIIPCGIYHAIIDWISDQESWSSAAELWGRGMFQDKLTVNLPKRQTRLVYVSVGLCRVYPGTSPNLRLKPAASNKYDVLIINTAQYNGLDVNWRQVRDQKISIMIRIRNVAGF